MNNWYLIFLSLFILIFLFDGFLDCLNLRHLRKTGNIVPECFDGEIDVAELERINSYTREKLIFGLIHKTFNTLVIFVFIFLGLINFYNSLILSLNLNYYLNGILYLYILILLLSLLDIPFNLYSIFRIEKKYNFNTMSLKLWFLDIIKSQVISFIIFSILVFVSFFIVRTVFNWWIWVWLALFLFSLFIMYISPIIIEPLFNKFVVVEDDTLIGKLTDIMERAGIRLSRVLKVDASKRTKHTNAYFSGIGKVKRIVLYDTLLEKLNIQEIAAVIAHEAGHWKKKHILKRIIFIEAILFIACNLAYQIINSDFVIKVFGIQSFGFHSIEAYLPCVLFLVFFLFGLLSYVFMPIMNSISRNDEKEADVYAVKLVGDSEDLSSALRKLSKDNLSNLNPHKLYSFFHYSHPPLIERLASLEKLKRQSF